MIESKFHPILHKTKFKRHSRLHFEKPSKNFEGQISDFGRLLDNLWIEKRSLSNMVSNTRIDQIYLKAKNSGALGGKICGAGGGGFLMLFAPLEYQKNIKNELSGLIEVPFKFEPSGSKIIFFE